MSEQHDVVLIGGVHLFGLQTHARTGHLREFGKAHRFIIEQQLDDVLVRENQQRFETELAMLTEDLAENFVDDRLGGLDGTTPGAGWAGR